MSSIALMHLSYPFYTSIDTKKQIELVWSVTLSYPTIYHEPATDYYIASPIPLYYTVIDQLIPFHILFY